ncbi:hypothetical protein ABT47_04650 [Shewanella xiamenensis]|nr:hypothetical protein ABT47_04650 [Shewanella xiamenensis]
MKTPILATVSGFCFLLWQFGEAAFFKLGVLSYTFWELSTKNCFESVILYTFVWLVIINNQKVYLYTLLD